MMADLIQVPTEYGRIARFQLGGSFGDVAVLDMSAQYSAPWTSRT